MSTSPAPSGPRLVRFGVFEADPLSGDLRKHGLRVKLRGRPFQVLALLLERPGELITRDELRTTLWATDTFVDFDHGLNAAVNKLREALGDSADNPRFVETVPRRGYRFIAPVAPVSQTPTPDPAATAPAVAPPAAAASTPAVSEAVQPAPIRRVWSARGIAASALALAVLVAAGAYGVRRALAPPAREGPTRIAVLPFQNNSGDPSQEYFVDGLTDALITELAQIRALRVISRTSVLPYKTARKPLPVIAQELGVDVVVEGAALQSGGRVRITAQLIDARSDRHLWARSYDCDLADVLDVQRRVASEVTQEIRVAVSQTEDDRLSRSSPVDPRAYEAYLRGRVLREKLTESDVESAIEYFRSAVTYDPAYADAWAGMAAAYWILGAPGFDFRPQRETAPQAKAAARKALELDPSLASARATLAMLHLEYDWDWAAADRDMKMVLEQAPSFAKAHVWYSSYLTAMGRHEESIAAAMRGLDLDPLSATAGQTLAIRYYYAGRFDRALEHFATTLELDPGAYVARLGRAQCHWRLGQPRRALPEVERAVADSGGSVYVAAWLGYLYATSGQPARARDVLARLEDAARARYVSPFHRALVHAGLGERGLALAWLEKAYEERSGWMAYLAVEPEFAALRTDPAFRDLLRRVGHAG